MLEMLPTREQLDQMFAPPRDEDTTPDTDTPDTDDDAPDEPTGDDDAPDPDESDEAMSRRILAMRDEDARTFGHGLRDTAG